VHQRISRLQVENNLGRWLRMDGHRQEKSQHKQVQVLFHNFYRFKII
jgi:hypothetical protein